MKPTPEAFEQWRHSPVTEWLMDTFLKAEMERTKRRFEEMAWDGNAGHGDDYREIWAAYHERHDVLDWMRGLDMEIIEKTMEMQE